MHTEKRVKLKNEADTKRRWRVKMKWVCKKLAGNKVKEVRLTHFSYGIGKGSAAWLPCLLLSLLPPFHFVSLSFSLILSLLLVSNSSLILVAAYTSAALYVCVCECLCVCDFYNGRGNNWHWQPYDVKDNRDDSIFGWPKAPNQETATSFPIAKLSFVFLFFLWI